jgi:hypothetical protein
MAIPKDDDFDLDEAMEKFRLGVENRTIKLDDDDEEDGDVEAEAIDEPRVPYGEDQLLYWARLDREGWTMEEMLSQGLIDVDTYPFFDEERDNEPISFTKRTLEELMSLEEIIF